uniref:Uncharacterized protein n=1 Tax=Sinocyclocheilus grahami TaxID=75366 RepID=A0A672PPG0_SINGR
KNKHLNKKTRKCEKKHKDCQIYSAGIFLYLMYVGMHKKCNYLFRNKHGSPVKSCVFSWDGQLFASASHDCSVRIWSRSSTECTHTLTTPILISQWELMFVWCLMSQSGEMLEDLRGHTAAVQSRLPATGSWDRTVRVCKLHEEKEPVTLQGHQGDVACVCFSVSGTIKKNMFSTMTSQAS